MSTPEKLGVATVAIAVGAVAFGLSEFIFSMYIWWQGNTTINRTEFYYETMNIVRHIVSILIGLQTIWFVYRGASKGGNYKNDY